MDGCIQGITDPGEWIGGVLDRELLLGGELHAARIVTRGLKVADAYVWIRYRDAGGAMRVGRVTRTRVKAGSQQPAGTPASAVLGSWWSGFVEGCAARGQLVPGYAYRVDILAGAMAVYSAAPHVQVRRDYLRAKAINAAGAAIGNSADFVGDWESAAARYAAGAAALLAQKTTDYIAAGGSV